MKYRTEEFRREILYIVENKKTSYIEAITIFMNNYDIPVDIIGKMVNRTLLDEVTLEAQRLKLLR